MLKTLVLCGFKSFADRTEFQFAQGITGIVGPNGSGKSNIVDAVKWVLGEQSAKSLRGGEMTDVIFNGSASRRSLGLAEVTMIFDNTRRALATEAEEVQITRRVYRSGEGEYLINGEVCRLKDIKQLFLGSGAGTDAYCIIEQGRVDVLLQASTKERRTIFEEAAGISRFKAKKIETLRKLERVDQNVQRLKDIIDEVEAQQRSVKLQAAKAQRYQEYSERLKELRLTLGLQEYEQVAAQLAAETTVLEALRAELAQQSAQASAWEQELARLEAALRQCEEEARAQEAQLATARQQIASEQKTFGHEASLTSDLEAELAKTRVRIAELTARVAQLAADVARSAAELHAAEEQAAAERRGVQGVQDELQRVLFRVSALQKQVTEDKEAHVEQVRREAWLESQAISFKARLDQLSKEIESRARKSEEAAANLATVDLELRSLEQAHEDMQARLAEKRQRLADRQQERHRLGLECDQQAVALSDLRARRSGVASRVEVLEGLERSQEGVGSGAREVLELLAGRGPENWQTVAGMVADLLTVRREYAPLIDVALGDRAQRFVVRDAARLREALRARTTPFSGRVGFLPLAAPESVATVDVPADPGVIASAASLVHCDNKDLEYLPRQLLGNTLIVRDLATAEVLATPARGYRCVTLQGEVVEPDGTLTVGTHHAETGILSRKSELRELRAQAAALNQEIAAAERALAELRDRVASLDTEAESLAQEAEVLAEEAGKLATRLGERRQERKGLQEEVDVSRLEISQKERDLRDGQEAWEKAAALAEKAKTQARELKARLDAAERELREREASREELQNRCKEAEVGLGKVEERVAGLRASHRKSAADLEQRREELAQAEASRAQTVARLADSQRAMLAASAALARCYLEKEDAERRLVVTEAERAQRRSEHQALRSQALAMLGDREAKQEQAHHRELQVNDLRHKRDTLVDRLREDYQVDLAELAAARAVPSADNSAPESEQTSDDPAAPLDPKQAQEEIAELRRKLTKLGAVNMDALEELKQVEARAAALHAQYDDLSAAKRSLEEIIAKINDDSRKLFTETFATIRANFQELFRKLFGGGMADIVLEDESDILESGIEIIARPPGKELRSISLMSGGEKTMTAVALLLAIFRSKPSPFCILDEVDAALDEANIGRYAAVLREFLDRSHFIIVTHSKRTMATCDVLYGITMQESGISKRVAVRFEDWPDDSQDDEPADAPALGAFGGK